MNLQACCAAWNPCPEHAAAHAKTQWEQAAKLEAECVRLREALRLAREGLGVCHRFVGALATNLEDNGQHLMAEQLREALAAIDAAVTGEEGR